LLIVGAYNAKLVKTAFPSVQLVTMPTKVRSLMVSCCSLFSCFSSPSGMVEQIREIKNRVFLATNVSRYDMISPFNIFHFLHLFVDYEKGATLSLQNIASAIAPFKMFSNTTAPSDFTILDSLCLQDFETITQTEKQLQKHFKRPVKFQQRYFYNVKLNSSALHEWYIIFVELCKNQLNLQPQHDLTQCISNEEFNTWHALALAAHKERNNAKLSALRKSHPLASNIPNNETNETNIGSAMVSRILFQRDVRKFNG